MASMNSTSLALTDDVTNVTEGDEGLLSVALLLEFLLLACVLALGRALHHWHVQWIGEAGAALLLGVVAGMIVRAAGVATHIGELLTFKSNLFMYVLLPTIMFDAGYSLDPRPFVRNIGSVCMYAFAGTTIATFVTGYAMYLFGSWGWCYQMSAIHNLIFGALISATDPVTVLAVFSALGANEDLYINVFGESVLNDAVGMVLYNTISRFVNVPVSAGSVFSGIGIFFGIFTASVLIGLAMGFLVAFLFRTHWFLTTDGAVVECGMVIVAAFVSYLLADCLGLSGICAILFCGMFMNAYVRPNLSEASAQRVAVTVKTLAGLFELFLFVNIGITLFLVDEKFNIIGYTALCLVVLGVARAANIYPCTLIVNYMRHESSRIPQSQQFMMWWSGLRGAMAFALAVDASQTYGEPGQVMKTCTFYVIAATVLVNGGSCGTMLDRLNLRQPIPDDAASALESQPLAVKDGGSSSDDATAGGGVGALRVISTADEETPCTEPCTPNPGAVTSPGASRPPGLSPVASSRGDRPEPWSADGEEASQSPGAALGTQSARSVSRIRRTLDSFRDFNSGKFEARMEALDKNVLSKLLISPTSPGAAPTPSPRSPTAHQQQHAPRASDAGVLHRHQQQQHNSSHSHTVSSWSGVLLGRGSGAGLSTTTQLAGSKREQEHAELAGDEKRDQAAGGALEMQRLGAASSNGVPQKAHEPLSSVTAAANVAEVSAAEPRAIPHLTAGQSSVPLINLDD